MRVSRSVHRPTGRGRGGRGGGTAKAIGGYDWGVGTAKVNTMGRGGGESATHPTGLEKKLDDVIDGVEKLAQQIKDVHAASATDVNGGVSTSEATGDETDAKLAVAAAVEAQGKVHKLELEAMSQQTREVQEVLNNTKAKLSEVQNKLEVVEESSKKTEGELTKKIKEIAEKDTQITALTKQVSALTGEVVTLKEETKTQLEKMAGASEQKHRKLQRALEDTKKRLVDKDAEMAEAEVKRERQATVAKQAQDEINKKHAAQMEQMMATLAHMQQQKEQPTDEEWSMPGLKVNTPTREIGGGGKSAKIVIRGEDEAGIQFYEPEEGSGQMVEEMDRVSEEVAGMTIDEPVAGSGQMVEEVAQAYTMETTTPSRGLEESGVTKGLTTPQRRPVQRGNKRSTMSESSNRNV